MKHEFLRTQWCYRHPLSVIATLLVSIIAGLALVPVSEGAEVSIPPVLFATVPHVDNTFPMWVSADAAIAADGELVTDLFHPHLHSKLRMYLETPPDLEKGCIPLGERFLDRIDPPDRSYLGGAVKHSSVVLLGEIVGRDFGFERALPGQLFAVRPIRTYKGEAGLDHYYFFVPVGRFSAGPYTFCKTDYRYPNPPQLGDQVLIMAPTREENGPYLNIQDGESLIVFNDRGQGRLSSALRLELEDASASLHEPRPPVPKQEILQRIEALTRGSGQ